MSPRNKNPDASRTETVVGLFHDASRAERAVRDLQGAGFSGDQIGVLMRDRDRERRLAEDTGSKAGEGAAAGAVGGGVLGGALGLLAGVGALVIPGIGPIVAGGALASTLAGAGIGAAAGGLIGALIGMGVPEEEARYYERGIREGGILVAVDAGARMAEARRTLLNAGGDFGPAATTGREVAEAGQERLEFPEENQRREPWGGKERRYRHDPAYAGRERRVATV